MFVCFPQLYESWWCVLLTSYPVRNELSEIPVRKNQLVHITHGLDLVHLSTTAVWSVYIWNGDSRRIGRPVPEYF